MSTFLPPSRFLNRATPPHLITLILMASLSSLTMNIFLPALPAMAEFYGTGYGTVQLSISVYLALSAVLQIVLGPLADRYGRRAVSLGSCFVFCLASLGIIWAPSAEWMLFFRMLQAAVASLMVLSRAVVRDMVPANQAAAMIGWVTMGTAVVPMFAPSIGGLLEQAFGWQAIFVLMFALGAFILGLVWADLGETSVRTFSSFRAQMRAYPQLLRSRLFWGYALAGALGSGVYFTFLGGAPAVGTMVYGLSSAELGLYLAVPGLGYITGNFLSGKFSTAVGIEKMVHIGCGVIALGLAVMLAWQLVGGNSPFGFFVPMILCGCGNGLLLPSATAGMMSVRSDLIASASGLGAALSVAGGAALSAVASLVVGSGESAIPLIWLMIGTSYSVMAASYFLRRAR